MGKEECEAMSKYYKIIKKTDTVYILKWQIKTYESLQQLRGDTKVVLNSERQSSSSHNVIHCTVEEEMSRMFEGADKPITFEPVINKINKIDSNKIRKQDLRELLIRLFGSPLDNIPNIRPKKINSRRHTLPISLNVDEKILKPLKITNKRKSESGTIAHKNKRIKREFFGTETPIVDKLIIATDFTIPAIETHIALKTVQSQLNHCDIIQSLVLTRKDSVTKMNPTIIDLTKDTLNDYNVATVYQVKSESARVPQNAVTVPLLSPVSPAVPTQQAVIPIERRTLPPTLQEIPNNNNRSSPALIPPTFMQISNVKCALYLYPHLIRFIRWRKNLLELYYELTTFLMPAELSKEVSKMKQQCRQTTHIFGFGIAREMAKINVRDFRLDVVLSTIIDKFRDDGFNDQNNFFMVRLLNIFIQDISSEFKTPFARKFFEAIVLSNKRLEQKMSNLEVLKTTKLTLSQLNQLELQIRQFWAIQNWLKVYQFQQQQKSNANMLGQVLKGNKVQNTANSQRSPCYQKRQPKTKTVTQITQPTNCTFNVPRPDHQNMIVNYRIHGMISPSVTTIPIQCQVSNGNMTGGIVLTSTQAQNPRLMPPIEQNSNTIEPDPPSNNQTNIVSQSCYTEVEDIKPIVLSPPTGFGNDVIDLTWIDDGDEDVLEEVREFKVFPFKIKKEEKDDDQEGCAVSDLVLHDDNNNTTTSVNNGSNCLCGKRALYICRCKVSMYCSAICQNNDWRDHQKLCQKLKK